MLSLLLAFSAISMLSVVDICSAEQATAFFVFGDSSVDTGNVPNSSFLSPWKYPYGVSWPGHPYGRFSSGKIQSDFIAQMLGLPPPVPYGLLNDSARNMTASKGINFAVAGSGVFDTYGFPKLGTQVGFFKDIIRSQKYRYNNLNHSVALVTVMGNDYAPVNLTQVGRTKFAKSVITEMKMQLTELYKLGFRNFLVSNVMPFDCLPANLKAGTVCLNTTMDLVSAHNEYLSEAVSELTKLEDANFLILDTFKAFSLVISNPTAHGIHYVNKSCCSSRKSALNYIGCGLYDKEGKPMFHVCKHPERALFFDWYHLTQKGWEALTNLYYSHTGFVQDGSSSSSPTSLAEWLHSHNVGLNSSPPDSQSNH
ncbi:hypothetical protein SUGI_0357800 [Cryptomeria japonica]|nr:hypothetical protein SUGI_0357800 [Cryptomeria japonica]